MIRLITGMLLASTLAACAVPPAPHAPLASTSGTTFTRTGQVTQVRDVTTVPDQRPGVGALLGGMAGGLAGSQLGGGIGRSLGAVGGGIAGTVAGHHVERTARTSTTSRVSVRFDSGDMQTYSVPVQHGFRVGDVVRVTTHSDGRAELKR